jgi:hypothetical protein
MPGRFGSAEDRHHGNVSSAKSLRAGQWKVKDAISAGAMVLYFAVAGPLEYVSGA